jgi:hypothetical protein
MHHRSHDMRRFDRYHYHYSNLYDSCAHHPDYNQSDHCYVTHDIPFVYCWFLRVGHAEFDGDVYVSICLYTNIA